MHKQRAEEIVKRLQVGNKDSKGRWNSDRDPFAYVAKYLYDHIAECRKEAHLLIGKIYYPRHSIAYSANWEEKAEKLPVFRRDTWREWWNVAEQVLLETYPCPESQSAFFELACRAEQRLKPEKRKPKGIRGRILYEIRERFKSLAGCRRKLRTEHTK